MNEYLQSMTFGVIGYNRDCLFNDKWKIIYVRSYFGKTLQNDNTINNFY